MINDPSFSQTYLCIPSMLESPQKSHSSTSLNFHQPISPLLFHKIILTISTNIPFLYTSAIFHLPLFAYTQSNNLHQKHFLYLSHFANLLCINAPGSCEGSCEVWNYFNLFLLPQGMESDNRAHNHWFFIAQTQKIGVLLVWQTIESNLSDTFKLLSLLPYLTNTTRRTYIPLKNIYLTWFAS